MRVDEPCQSNRCHDRSQVIEWDKDDIDLLRFMKVNVLAIGMFTCGKRTVEAEFVKHVAPLG
ncbi:hypothetical protein [Mesorhizobium sp. M1295]|uniref:hypothetical protein n=1 Tax=Mesorhizobium sp. M1295 TaxID=2957076 RepID=UPI0033355465